MKTPALDSDPTIEERFWPKVQRNELTSCWEWTGMITTDWGYGLFQLNGRKHGAHRIAWLLIHGYLPKQFVCHRCDNPRCVNFHHLRLDNIRGNNRERHFKGRSRGFFTGPLQIKKHYRPGFLTRTREERFSQYLNKTDTCWLWTGSKNERGYGQFRWSTAKNTSSHRASFIIHKGNIPRGLMVLHTCDVPACCNPDHLYAGTGEDNGRDALERGRRHFCVGEKMPNHKLTDAQIIEMRRLYDDNHWGYKRLHKHFGVSCGVAKRIVKRQCWKHI